MKRTAVALFLSVSHGSHAVLLREEDCLFPLKGSLRFAFCDHSPNASCQNRLGLPGVGSNPSVFNLLASLSHLVREVWKAEEKEVPEDSVEECAVSCSNTYGPSESKQPQKNSKITFEEDQVDSTLLIDRGSSPDGWQDALNLVPGSLCFPCVSYLF